MQKQPAKCRLHQPEHLAGLGRVERKFARWPPPPRPPAGEPHSNPKISAYFTRVSATSRTGAMTSGTFSIFTEEVSRPKYWASPEMNCLM
jgi:hypothetical protein